MRCPLQPFAQAFGNGAEILADDEAAVALRFQSQDGEQIGKGVAHVAAVGGAAFRRDPKKPREAHDVIDAERPGVPHVGAQQRDEGGESPLAQGKRVRRREAPVLPCTFRGSGGAPTVTPESSASRSAQASQPFALAPTARSR